MTRFPDATITTVLERAEGACEVRGDGCTWRVVEVHHRRPRGMGGRPRASEDHTDCPCCALAVCRACHSAIEADLEFHRDNTGRSVSNHEEQPFSRPVQMHDGWWWTWCDGSRTECDRDALVRLDLADRTDDLQQEMTDELA